MMKQIGEDARLSQMNNRKMTKILQFIKKTIYPELLYRPDYVINTSDFQRHFLELHLICQKKNIINRIPEK